MLFRSDSIVRLLLEHGANVDVEDDEGRTPSQIASQQRHGILVQLLSGHRTCVELLE